MRTHKSTGLIRHFRAQKEPCTLFHVVATAPKKVCTSEKISSKSYKWKVDDGKLFGNGIISEFVQPIKTMIIWGFGDKGYEPYLVKGTLMPLSSKHPEIIREIQINFKAFLLFWIVLFRIVFSFFFIFLVISLALMI